MSSFKRWSLFLWLGLVLAVLLFALNPAPPAQAIAATVTFGANTYSVAEGSSVDITVTLSAAPAPSEMVTIPITAVTFMGATADDYTAPTSVTFTSGQTSKTVSFAATADSNVETGEQVYLSFGTKPTGVTDGPRTTTTITITDGPAFAATVTFDSATYSVAEGDMVDAGLTLSAAPGAGQTVTIPITTTIQGTTAAGDYSVATSVAFGATETTKTVLFSATDDTDEDHGDSVQLGFEATLPTGVTSTAPITTTVTIIDDDPPYRQLWHNHRVRRRGR